MLCPKQSSDRRMATKKGRPYQCPLCASVFLAKNESTWEKELANHVKEAHRTGPNSKPYHCTICETNIKKWKRHAHRHRHTLALRQSQLGSTQKKSDTATVTVESVDPDISEMKDDVGSPTPHSNPPVCPDDKIEEKEENHSPTSFLNHLSWLKKYLPDKDPKLHREVRKEFEPRSEGKPLSFTTRELLRIWREGPVTEANVQKFLDLMNSPDFRKEDLVENTKSLQKEEKLSCPFPGQYEVLDQEKKTGVFCFDIIELLPFIFSDANLRRRCHFSYSLPRSGKISHPMNSEGAKEYHSFKVALQKHQGRKYDWLLLMNIFVDQFERSEVQKKKCWMISMTPANLPKNEYVKAKHKYVLAIVPCEGVDLDTILHEVVVKPLQRLERGIELSIGGETISACGSLHLLLGDHPGQSEVIGLIGPRAGYPDRFHVVHRNFLDLTRQSAAAAGIPFPQERDSLATLDLLDECVSSAQGGIKGPGSRSGAVPTATEAKETLRRQGLRPKRSCLWNLTWFRVNLFKRIGLCYMHCYV